MAKKRKESYYDKLESSHVGMNMRFDRAPYMMLAANLICGLVYMISCGIAMDNEMIGLVKVMTIILGLSISLGVIYTISAIFKRTRKTFPLAITSVFISFVIIWNASIISDAIKEFWYWAEWIPMVIFGGVLCAWVVFSIRRIRKEMRGETLEPLEIPFWLIVVGLISYAPILTFAGRHSLGDWIPDNILVWYFAFVTLELDIVLTQFLIKLILFCKGRLSGRI